MLFFKSIRVHFSGDKKLYSFINNLFGFYPGNITLYKLALKHKSIAKKESNERLEFLGDAVFGIVVADYLFKKFPFKDEGFLTEMRSRIVSRNMLNQLAKKLGIASFLEANVEKEARNMSIVGDALEALIGAIYLDKGYKAVSQIIVSRIIAHHIDIEDLESIEKNYKSQLIEWAHKEKKTVSFEAVEENGTGFSKQYTVSVFIDGEIKGSGIDFSKKRAEQIAAEKAFQGIKTAYNPEG